MGSLDEPVMLIPKGEQRDLLIYAFRYALGRMSMSVLTVSQVIIDSWAALSKHDKELMHREIKQAIESGRAGERCDIARWQIILNKDVN